jgi:hypothetical protein
MPVNIVDNSFEPDASTANEELNDEINALHAIYSTSVLTPQFCPLHTYLLTPPAELVQRSLCLTVEIPPTYPLDRPTVLSGDTNGIVQDALNNVWRHGEVCFYDLLEALQEAMLPEAGSPLPSLIPPSHPLQEEGEEGEEEVGVIADIDKDLASVKPSQHPWTTSDPIVEKKSVFVARAIAVSSADEAKLYIRELIAGDKKIAKATHNISGDSNIQGLIFSCPYFISKFD